MSGGVSSTSPEIVALRSIARAFDELVGSIVRVIDDCLANGGSVGTGGSGGPLGFPIVKPGNSNYIEELLELDGIAKGASVGAGGSGGPPGNPFDFLGLRSNVGFAFLGLRSNGGFAGSGLVNGMYDGSGMANGFAGAGGLGGSPVENSNGSGGAPIDVGGGDSPSGSSGGDSAYSGHYPFGGGGGDSPQGGGGHSPFGSSGLAGPGIDDAESYPSVRSSVSVDMNEIVSIVRVKGRAKHRTLRTSVKVKGEKVRHTIRFKRTNARQGLAEM